MKQNAIKNRLVLLATLFALASGASGQDKSGVQRYVVVPPENVLLVTASQPGCPVEITNAKLLNPVDGRRRAAFVYELRNRGVKPIRFVSVYALNSDATGGGPLYNGHVMKRPLMPGQTLLVGAKELEVTALTTELRARLKLTNGMRVVVVLLVKSVEYTDQTVFSDPTTIKALDDYFLDINSEAINSRANPSPNQEKRKPHHRRQSEARY